MVYVSHVEMQLRCKSVSGNLPGQPAKVELAGSGFLGMTKGGLKDNSRSDIEKLMDMRHFAEDIDCCLSTF
jgi:hypothetical protein